MSDDREIAGKVVVDRRDGSVTVNGQPLPWLLSADTGVTVQVSDEYHGGINTVVLGILCDDVEVIPADREKS